MDHFVPDIEKNDSGQIISVDTQVGCNSNLPGSNYLEDTVYIGQFKLGSTDVDRSKEPIFSKKRLGVKLLPGETHYSPEEFIVGRWISGEQNAEPTSEEREDALKRYGCVVQEKRVYISYKSPASFVKIGKKRKLSTKTLKNLGVGHPDGMAPIQIRH